MTNYDTPPINKNSIITLREVTKENLWDIFALEVAPERTQICGAQRDVDCPGLL